MASAVVVGGGIGGMAFALFAARRGHEVTVVDRDPPPPAGAADELVGWERPGVAQAQHAHYFLARSTRVLREEAPDVLDAMASLGITPSEVRFGEGMEDDRALTARRPVWEATLRRVAQDEPGVTTLTGSVRGLVTAPGDPSRVVGVRVRDGDGPDDELVADVVVDAGGRRSASGRWLAGAGLAPPVVEEHPCELHYLGRHHRLREGAEYPSTTVPIVQPLPYGVVLVFIGDNRTFSMAMAVSAHDPLRHRLQDAGVWDRVLRSVPMMAEWLERAEPVGDVRVMAGLSNRWRRLATDGRAPTPGLVLLGDSALYTNPAEGQGVSLTCWMAQRLAADLDRAPTDAAALSAAHEAWVAHELVPRWRHEVASDLRMSRQFRAGVDGAGWLPPEDGNGVREQAAMVLAMRDEAFLQQARRVGHLLAPVSTLFGPEVTDRLDAIAEDDLPPGPPGGAPLSREDFERLVTVA
jgi:2-polyprenyl-6-methoxyphenol hydroxylase-like FAD-dependent oxidoreductase